MNKQSNLYTVVYIIVLVLIVGTGLAFAALSLKEKQTENADNDKRRQILASVGVSVPENELIREFNRLIVSQVVLNEAGDSIGADAFAINVAQQSKLPAASRELPLYVCNIDGSTKYIIPLYGAGLWGPIWGYVSLNDNCSTVYGAFFDHQGETPGLGAEITKPDFYSQFAGKELFKNGQFLPIAVVKKGQKPAGNEDYVDGISGGTITSKGVGAMLDSSLTPYKAYLDRIAAENAEK